LKVISTPLSCVILSFQLSSLVPEPVEGEETTGVCLSGTTTFNFQSLTFNFPY